MEYGKWLLQNADGFSYWVFCHVNGPYDWFGQAFLVPNLLGLAKITMQSGVVFAVTPEERGH